MNGERRERTRYRRLDYRPSMRNQRNEMTKEKRNKVEVYVRCEEDKEYIFRKEEGCAGYIVNKVVESSTGHLYNGLGTNPPTETPSVLDIIMYQRAYS